MSNKREREKRREERLAEETKGQSQGQRKRILQIGSAAVFIAIAVVVVLIVAAGGGDDDGGDVQLEEVTGVDRLMAGIPQSGMTIGDPNAKVTLIEFGDLQCPACAAYADEILPGVIEGAVKDGRAKLEFRNFTIIGPESTTAGEAAVAAGEQNRAWQFLDIFYHNQGGENAGYVTDDFLEAVAKAAGVADLAKFNEDRKSKAVEKQVAKTVEEAQNFGFSSTPSFAVEGPGAQGGIELLSSSQTSSSDALEDVIEEAG